MEDTVHLSRGEPAPNPAQALPFGNIDCASAIIAGVDGIPYLMPVQSWKSVGARSVPAATSSFASTISPVSKTSTSGFTPAA